MRQLFWLISALSSLLGLAALGFTLAHSTSDVSLAAGAALSLAIAGIPYCLARAATELHREAHPAAPEPARNFR